MGTQSPLPDSIPASRIPPIPVDDLRKLSDRDGELLEAWMDHDIPLHRLKVHHNVNVVELAIWANQPHIAALLDLIQRLATRRANTHLAQTRTQSIQRLAQITLACANEETARRAADRLARLRPFATPPLELERPESPPPPPAPPPPEGGDAFTDEATPAEIATRPTSPMSPSLTSSPSPSSSPSSPTSPPSTSSIPPPNSDPNPPTNLAIPPEQTEPAEHTPRSAPHASDPNNNSPTPPINTTPNLKTTQPTPTPQPGGTLPHDGSPSIERAPP